MIKFGQTVVLTVVDSSGKVVLDSAGLRVDFDVREIRGFNRATFTIYNLNNEVIGRLNSAGTEGVDLYATLDTQLHDGQVVTIAKDFSINNVIDQRKLPNKITTLYCTDLIRRKYLQEHVDIIVQLPTLENSVKQIVRAVQFVPPKLALPPLSITYQGFPDDLVSLIPPRPDRPFQGSAQQCIRELEGEFGFNMYTKDGGLLLLYKPNLDNVNNTELPDKEEDVVLSTRDMRSNPLIGIGNLSVTSILDFRIRPGTVLDISKLLTAGTSENAEDLQVVKGFLKDAVVGFSKYQAFSVQHKGSNYTGDWHTICTALSPTKGMLMPTNDWWRI